SRSRGLANTTASACAREIATLRRLTLNRNSMLRGNSSALEVAIEIKHKAPPALGTCRRYRSARRPEAFASRDGPPRCMASPPGCRPRRWGAGCRRDLDAPGRSRIDRRQRWRPSPRDLIGCFRHAPRPQSVSRLAPAVAVVSGGSVAALPLACRVEATVVDRTRDVIAYQWMETPGDCRNSRSWASRLPWISFPLAGSSVGTDGSPFRYRRSSVVACAHP